MEQNVVDCLVTYSKRCLNCSHLVDGAEKKYSKCHFTKGNVDCPAQSVRIITDGKTRQYQRRLDAAQQEKDAKAVASIWAEINNESPAVRQRLFEVLTSV